MCITLPGRVIEVGEGKATIDIFGRQQKIKILDTGITVGDWVLSANDYAVKKISAAEAKEIAGLFDYYPPSVSDSGSGQLRAILSRSLQHRLNREEIQFLLRLENPADLSALYSQANVLRLSQALNHICVHGIIEFSNHCQNNCGYCGLNRDNRELKRYRLSDEEIISTAVAASNDRGYKILVLQSGEDDYYDLGRLKKIIAEIKKQARVFIYLSIGDRPLADYRELKKIGAGGILMRFETVNPDLHYALRQKNSTQRIELIKQLKNLDYIIATGFLIGLPGQTIGDLANDLLTLAELAPFMPSIGPLVPSKNTPLSEAKPVDKDLVLKIIAIVRLLLPAARIPITTAMETLYGESFRQEAFLSGANSVMLNLTPAQCREDYYIYENKFFDEEKKFEKWALFKGDLSYQMLEQELKTAI